MTTTTYADVVRKEVFAYKARLFRKKFVALEDIAKDPKRYGYLRIEARDSKARQNDFINDPKKVTAAIAANRSGKTESAVIKFLKICLKRKGGGNAWVLTESFDAQKLGVQEKIEEYLKPEDIKDIGYAKKGVFAYLKLTNGVYIEFKTYEQGRAKLQAAKLFAALFDEEPPEDIYEEVYTRTLDLQGQVILAFTPLQGMTWSYDKIFNNKGGKVGIYNWGMMDNPFIPMSEIEECIRNWSAKKVKMRIFGQYQGAERAIYENFYRSKHVRPDLYKRELPVDVSVDWGIDKTAIGFYQCFKGIVTDIKTGIPKMKEEHYLIDAVELSGSGYPQVMKYILSKGYWIENYFCDPAGRGRSQASRSGKSLLDLIREEFGIRFTYMIKLGVEESIDVVNSYFENAQGDARLFFQEGIKLNAKGDSPEMRVEGYLRDEETKEPVKDGINDHFCDQLRYYIMNKIRGSRGGFSQH